MNVACLENEAVCTVERDSPSCGDEHLYCDLLFGCSPRPPCDLDADGIPDIEDNNSCTIDACSQEGEVVHIDRDEGESCLLVGDLEGQCLGGECRTARPKDPMFGLQDGTTGNFFVSLTQNVNVLISNHDPSWVGYHLSETATLAPSQDDPGWRTSPPSAVRLSRNNGQKTLYLWVRNADGFTNPGVPPARATIQLSEGLRRVGPGENACPVATQGGCNIVWRPDSNAIQAAVDASDAGDTIWLYPLPEGEVYRGTVRVDRSLVIEGAPGEDPNSIVVGGPHVGPLPAFRLVADGVTLRAFRINGDDHSRMCGGVTADKGSSNERDSDWSGGHLIERMTLAGLVEPGKDGRDLCDALFVGDDTVVRNNFIYGLWYRAIDVSGTAGRPLSNTRVLHNTLVMTGERAPVHAGLSRGVKVRNNVLINLDDGGTGVAVRGEQSQGLEVSGNLIGGRNVVATGQLIAPVEQLTDPKIVHMRDPRLAQGSLGLNRVAPDLAAGTLDLYGNPRVIGGASEVGAVETNGEAPVGLSSVIRIGVSERGCPASSQGRCDFVETPDGVRAIGRALEAAPAGATINLYSDNMGVARYAASNSMIDRKLVIRRAPGEPAGTVALHDSLLPRNGPNGIFWVVQADDVRIEGLDFGCFRCRWAVSFHLGIKGDRNTSVAARRGVIHGCRVREDMIAGGNRGFVLGHETRLSASVVAGRFRALARVEGHNAVAVNNTFYHLDDTLPKEGEVAATGFELSSVSGFLAANNLVDFQSTRDVADYTVYGATATDATNPRFENNQFYGLDSLHSAEVRIRTRADGGTNCVGSLPGRPPARALCGGTRPLFVNPSDFDFRLSAGSPAWERGDPDYVGDDTDVLGRSRTNPPDVGAYEESR